MGELKHVSSRNSKTFSARHALDRYLADELKAGRRDEITPPFNMSII